MEAKLVIFAALCCTFLVVQQVCSDPLEDQLPETSGLFFGKRSQHPNMNNLLFGRRSYAQLAAKLQLEDARQVCQAVRETCAKWGVDGDN